MGSMEAAVHTKKDLLDRLKGLKADFHQLGVMRIGLFGSFLHDTSNDASDVDLLVEFEPGKKSFDNFMTLSFRLEDVLKRRVELVTLESLSPYIGPHIMKEIEYVEVGN